MNSKKKSLQEFSSPESLLLRQALAEERGRKERLKALQEVFRSVAEKVLEPLRVTGNVTPYKVPARASKNEEVQVLHLSDLQIGLVEDNYNLSVFEAMMDQAFRKVLSLCEIQRRDHPVHDLVIALNGDLVEGEGIYPGQAWKLEDNLLTQVTRGAQILAAKIARLSPHYRKISITVTRGNHGRSFREASEETNWDLVLGELLAVLLSKIENVRVQIVREWYASYEILGWKVMQTHGDRIRSGGDFPFTAILKRANLWKGSIGWNILLIGHFHSYAEFSFQRDVVFVNGTTVPKSDYALSYMGMIGRPCQGMFFVDREHGVTARLPIYLSVPSSG